MCLHCTKDNFSNLLSTTCYHVIIPRVPARDDSSKPSRCYNSTSLQTTLNRKVNESVKRYLWIGYMSGYDDDWKNYDVDWHAGAYAHVFYTYNLPKTIT